MEDGRVTGAGVAAGTALSRCGAARWCSAVLYGVSPPSGDVYLGSGADEFGCGAGVLPSGAVGDPEVDPARTLREESREGWVRR